MSDKTFLGIDVGKSKLDCALLLPDGRRLDKSAPYSPEGLDALNGWLARKGGACAHVCLEATNIYWEDAAQFFAERGHTVSVVNPAQIKAHAGARLARSKTDKGDAGLIRLLRQAQPAALAAPQRGRAGRARPGAAHRRPAGHAGAGEEPPRHRPRGRAGGHPGLQV
jgi:transposase